MADHIMPYWPEYYKDIPDFIQLAESGDVELDRMESAITQLFDDQFVLTSSVQAIKRREQMLGIQADPTTETLDFRKHRILNRYQTKPPFTIRWLQEQLDRLVGPGMTIVSVDVQNFVLYITTNVENANVFKELQHTIETVKPANLIYQQSSSLNADVNLEEHISTQEVTWNYKLNGSWKLGENPFWSLGAEVQIK
ncbi:phage portal protein [Paenibacillus macerans]|nr:phage portal protein [Paenibacillus macerans]